MAVEFQLVGGPGDGRPVRIPTDEYPPRYDLQCWDDFVEPLWARYLPVYGEDGLPKFYRFFGFVNGKWPSAWMRNYES